MRSFIDIVFPQKVSALFERATPFRTVIYVGRRFAPRGRPRLRKQFWAGNNIAATRMPSRPLYVTLDGLLSVPTLNSDCPAVIWPT